MTTDNDVESGIESDIRERIQQFFSAPIQGVDVEFFGQRLEGSLEAMASSLLSLIAIQCDIKLERLEETSKQALSDGRPIAIVDVSTTRFADDLSLIIPHASVPSLVGLMYGEPEDAAPITLSRELTELERHILQDMSKLVAVALLGDFVGAIKSTESSVATLGVSEEAEADQQIADIDVDMQFAFFELSFGGREAIPINVGFPASMLGELQELLADAAQLESDRSVETPNPEWSTKIKSKIDDTQIEVFACIVCPDATLAAIDALRPGHVLEIYQTNDSLVTLECDNEPIYRGSLGKVNGRLAVEVEAGVDHWNEFLCEMMFEADQSRDGVPPQ